MKKITLTTATLFCMLIGSTSCKSDSGGKWLESIFQCENGEGYCLPNEREVFTERYYQFYEESYGIFEFPFFDTEDEEIAAKDAFKKKWKEIYPLDNYVWPPFGQGNGMEPGDKLKNVTISRISNLKYSVLVEYSFGLVFSNKLVLVPSGDTFLIDYIETALKEGKAIQVDYSDPGIDKVLPIFMVNETNTILYDETSTDSQIVFILEKEDNRSLIGLTAVKDAENNVWYKCFYPKEQVIGWTRHVSHWDFSENEKYLPFLQNLTLANLQLGANPQDAERLQGIPQSQHAETGPLEVSGYIDEDYIVTTTTMEYDGIELIYQEDYMVQAKITKPGKSFGWITVADKACNKDYLIEKFMLTNEDFLVTQEGVEICYITYEILLIEVSLDEAELVKTITLFTSP